MIIEPHYPHILLSFAYRGCTIKIDRDEVEGKSTYAAWVDYERGCAVAVTSAITPQEAIKKAKKWIDRRLSIE